MNDSSKKSGGFREGAGRKSGTGTFGEPTEVIRVPVSQKSVIRDFLQAYARKQASKERTFQMDAVNEFSVLSASPTRVEIPLFNSKVPAGFPSPADDHVEKRLDPSEYLIDQQDATFFVTIQGESMLDAGLLPGDKAVVDRSKVPAIGDIVLAIVDGEFTIKTLSRKKDGSPRLLPANDSGRYQPIEITGEMQFEVWGVVIGSFRRFR